MPKHKIARKSTAIDMTAMCDVSFLLLTFFMLATKFKPPEQVEVVTPASIAKTKVPDADVITITIDKEGRVFFDMDGQPNKLKLIETINDEYKLNLNKNQMVTFAKSSGVGVPFSDLSRFLSIPMSEQKNYKSAGIPTDTALTDKNELFKWIAYARQLSPESVIAVKGDSQAKYPVVKNVFGTLANEKVKGHKFNLVTSMKEPPKDQKG